MNQVTAAEYLAADRSTDWKYEFDSGRLLEVPHPNRWHALIAGNTVATLWGQLRGRSPEAYSSRMRVTGGAADFYAYPDVVATENPQFENNDLDTLLNPTLVIEILSDSTEAYDRGRKFAHYRKLDSLREYLLVAQDRCHVEHYVRQPDNQWLLSETDDPQGEIALPSIECTLRMAEVYDKVRLAAADANERAG